MPDQPEAQAPPSQTFVPPIILRNKGVPVTLYRLENGKLPAIEEGDDQPTRTWHLRLTANHVADIEEAFDGLVTEVPVIERTPALGPDGTQLEGPAGPVWNERIVGRETRVFYGLEAFQKAMEVKTAGTVRRVVAIALGVSPEEAGNAMDPGRMLEYQNAVGVAWSIAQGVDPTEAAKVLDRANRAVAAARGRLASELTKTMVAVEDETTDSPGPTGPPPGSPLVEA